MLIDFLVPSEISWQFAAILVLASFFTSALTAALGLGGGVAMLAIMGTGMPVASLLPVHGIVQLGSNFGRTLIQYRHVIWPLVLWFLIGSVIGVSVGGPVVVMIPDALAKVTLGAFILWSVHGKKPKPERMNKGFFVLGGALTSFGTMIVGATGPLVAAMLSARGLTRQPLIATHATCMVLQHGLKILVFGLLGFAYVTRLLLTDRGRRLYGEVERIFLGLDQIGKAIEDIVREDVEVLRIGIVPALSGRVLQNAVQAYSKTRPDVRLSILNRESHLIADKLESGELDVLVASRSTEITNVEQEAFSGMPAVCILPQGHHLAVHDIITPVILRGENIVTLTSESTLRHRLTRVFEDENCHLSSTIEVSFVSSLCGFVEAGLGLSIVHPLVAANSGADLVTRPFEPAIPVGFFIYKTANNQTRPHVDDFIKLFHETAARLLDREKSG